MTDRFRAISQVVELGRMTVRPLIIAGGLIGIAKLSLACGYVNVEGQRFAYHDYPVKGRVGGMVNGPHVWNVRRSKNEPYNKEAHRPIEDFIEEGEDVPDIGRSHKHSGDEAFGSYEL